MLSVLLATWRKYAWKLTVVVIVLDVVIGAILRFSSTSKLWLDEALSVNIATHSFGQIITLLRHDGAPPLYYFLLHLWMACFGQSDVAVRSLSGVISLATLPAVFFLIRRVWDARAAWIAVGMVAAFPFAAYYAAEVRMYALVMLLSTLLLLAVVRVRDDNRWSGALLVAALTGLLLYTHYWSLYLLVMVGLYALIDVALRRTWGRWSTKLIVGLGAGALLWLPWFSIFNEQRIHTGTPWTDPPGIWQALTWPESFVVNQSTQHVTVSFHMIVELYAFVILMVLGALAEPIQTGWKVVLNLRGQIGSRLFAFMGLGTIVVGIGLAHFAKSAFVPRYAAVAALPVLFLCVRGVGVLGTPIRVFLAVLLFSGASLWTDNWGRHVQRTQAGQVAAALQSAPSGSLVFVCPDQLGPSLLRYAPKDLRYIGYPRLDNPKIVDWYDYKNAVTAMTPSRASERLAALASGAPAVYVVWASGYTLHSTCHDAMVGLRFLLKSKRYELVTQNLTGFYQSMSLEQLIPIH